MLAQEIRDAMLSWNPPEYYSSCQIARSLHSLPDICNGDYEMIYDETKRRYKYRIISYA